MELKGKKVLFLGDSITEGVGASCPENAYWQVFGRNTGAIVKGYGISGTRIAPQRTPEREGAESFAQYFGSRVESMDPEADVIVVFGGTNDFGHGDAPLGSMADREETSFYGSLHCLYRKLLAKYPTAEIVVMTPLHRGGEEAPINNFGLRNVTNLHGYVQAIREVAEFYAIPVLDLYRMSGMTPEITELRDTYMPDWLHPSDAGAARIASRLEGFLKTL
ncbi:MAG: SGNH/GDSL hydrolase family protein [Clostridia bacterium]|nr:SGNH/GDSL hydrolase family protein [Clostridia bacterium]